MKCVVRLFYSQKQTRRIDGPILQLGILNRSAIWENGSFVSGIVHRETAHFTLPCNNIEELSAKKTAGKYRWQRNASSSLLLREFLLLFHSFLAMDYYVLLRQGVEPNRRNTLICCSVILSIFCAFILHRHLVAGMKSFCHETFNRV